MLYFDERSVCSSSVGGWNIEWRCENSLCSVCKVQDRIVVPECSMLGLYDYLGTAISLLLYHLKLHEPEDGSAVC
jgi:hypothetical protein